MCSLGGFIILLILLILGFLANFYRKPKAPNYEEYRFVRAASYGTIKDIFVEDGMLSIVAFLSPLDVHMQYVPISGRIMEIIYDRTGQFHLAYKLGKSKFNEKMIHRMDNGIEIVQSAGFLTRRIESYLDVGQEVHAGEPLGFIKLGSRVDVRIPVKNIQSLDCKVGDQLDGGHTLLATLIPS